MRRVMRRLWSGVLAAACVFGGGGRIIRADELLEKLGPHVGKTLDVVELGTGKRFVRPTLENVVEREGKASMLRLKAEGETKVTSLPVAGIVKIVAGRETIHEAEAKGKGAGQLRGKRAKEAYDKQVAASLERMQARSVRPWPPLTTEEHATEVESLKKFVAEVTQAFPSLQATETHEFLVATDIPAGQMAPYVASLDTMHDFLCDLYGIPRGEPVWKGKCLVIAFLREQDFIAFEARFMKVQAQGVHGLCHQSSDGRVITACHRGDDAPAFAHMLVHETSHGFNHRWMSPERLPNWLNEGIAEWVGAKVVTHSNQVPLKEAQAVEFMRRSGTLGDDFFGKQNIDPVQYGIASSMVKFLAGRDLKKFAGFVQAIKEGTPVEESLRQAFKASIDDMVQAYGTAVGAPNLKK
jgi:hypothetical protein